MKKIIIIMITTTLYPALQRWRTRAWRLESAHSFSFGDYYNPDQMWFGPLRVINDDIIAGGSWFPAHPHRDMEIISIPLTWWLLHEDNLWNKKIITPDMIQVMSAGSGVTHSEYNASPDQAAAFLQIWIQPHTRSVSPRHEEKTIAYIPNSLTLLVSPDARDGSISIAQDALLYRWQYTDTTLFNYTIQEGRGLYLFVISGTVNIQTDTSYLLDRRDALSLTWIGEILITPSVWSDFLLFDMKM